MHFSTIMFVLFPGQLYAPRALVLDSSKMANSNLTDRSVC